jgi:excisionase family DNA binding protein
MVCPVPLAKLALAVSFISSTLTRMRQRISEVHTMPTTKPSLDALALTAKESARNLSIFLHTHADIQEIQIGAAPGKGSGAGDTQQMRIPTQALHLLREILVELGMGHDVRIIPVTAKLTTQEAADILNVSRPFLVQLLERGEIHYHKVGTHRRVCYEHLIAYKDRMEAEQRGAMDDLVAQAQELGMGYD